MMTVLDLAGYFASTMVLLTFLTKDMRLLRILAIFSNIGFVTYGLLAWLPPVFCLHLILLPVNAHRLREILTVENLQAPVAWPRIFAPVGRDAQLMNELWRLTNCDPGAGQCGVATRRRTRGIG
jgi:hypothetical protein